MKVRGSYHPFIFAPDSLGNDGPQVQMPERGMPPLGTQTTLPTPEPEPVLFDHRERAIYFENPRPARRAIGFRSRSATT